MTGSPFCEQDGLCADTSKEVSAAIKATLGCDVDKKKINIPMKIEGFGEFSAEARLYAGVSAKFTVNVTEA